MKRLFLLLMVLLTALTLPLSVVEANSTAYIVSNGQSIPIVCGDSICSVGENIRNCLIDCSQEPFAVRLETEEIILDQNGFEQQLFIESYVDSTFRLNTTTDLLQFSESSFYLARGNSKSITVTAHTDVGLTEEHIGSIIIQTATTQKVIPIKITPSTKGKQSANINLQVLNPQSFAHENIHLRLYATLYGTNVSTNPRLSLYIKKQGEEFESLVKEYVVNSTHLELYDSISLTHELVYGESNFLLNPPLKGDYELRLVLSYLNEEVQITRLLSVEESFFYSLYFRIPLAVIIGLPLFYFLLRGFYHFRDYRRSKKRYVAPAFGLLPKAKSGEQLLEVGKIADTKRNAFMIASDLTTHALVAGSTGSGKSVTASVIVEEALNKKIPAVIFDPTAQWTGFLSPLKDPNILKYYEKFGLTSDDPKSYKGLIFTPKNDEFDLTFDDYMNPGEVTVFNLSSLTTKQYDHAVKKIIDKMFAKKWEESPDLQLIVIFDEVHRLLDKSADGVGYEALTKACREFRKWGIGLVMASQVSSDFKEAIGGNVLTEVQLNTKNLEDIKKVGKKYGPDFAKRVTRQGIGVALVQNPKYNKGKPWFVNFRPPLHNPHKLSEEQLATYEEYTVKLLDIKKKIDLIKDKSDREDIMMDYQLAYNKLKEGKFKMAEIYIQGLFDRVK